MMGSAMGTGSIAVLLLSAALGQSSPADVGGQAGGPVAGFRLQDSRGGWHALEDAGESKLVVLVFLGVECPLSDLYATRLAALATRYGPQKAAFYGIDANMQDA